MLWLLTCGKLLEYRQKVIIVWKRVCRDTGRMESSWDDECDSLHLAVPAGTFPDIY